MLWRTDWLLGKETYKEMNQNKHLSKFYCKQKHILIHIYFLLFLH